PPAVLQAMFAARNFSPEKVRSVRGSGAGAADVSPELMREAKERFGGALVHRSYGMTECPMFTSGAPGDPEEKRFGTDGRPVPGCAARLADEARRPVGPNVEGELQVYGPQLCVGYLDPALNAAFTPDGFLRTGDLAVMDDEGYIRITGRRKDIIIRKGENLSAKGIEDDLAAHPKVADVAVIGVPDTQSGERVCACVVLRPGAGSAGAGAGGPRRGAGPGSGVRGSGGGRAARRGRRGGPGGGRGAGAAADGGARLGGGESKRRRRPRLPAPPSRVTLLARLFPD